MSNNSVWGRGLHLEEERKCKGSKKSFFFNFYEYKNRNLMGRMTVTRGGDSREGKGSEGRGNRVSIDF
jgi:hypothetical protein